MVTQNKSFITRAVVKDAQAIHHLINSYANQSLMLPRSLNEIYEHIRDFWVCKQNKKIVACCALHVVGWNGLAEVQSLAVRIQQQQRGLGTQLVRKCLQEAKALGVRSVFTLTYVPHFFQKLGFRKIPKKKLPHKIWSDCYKCPKFPKCDEEALIKSV